ncbi:hypothetical protein JD844_032914 [Phrynosoma platyrhinos]|uniref:Ig-like domain-containing protein n=1 Tax=Phrynosoma platyrhinos TaxID=52577 RepID=A0ABQ7T5T9_PHRPL|nr:hypothetical protein JD844_032914 [Phrynosoma platyrhinos]
MNSACILFRSYSVKETPQCSLKKRQNSKCYSIFCFFKALTEPKVTVKHIIDPEKAGKGVLEFSCSVTGKPEPMITWKFTKHLLIKPKQYVIQQLNETVTVVSNFTHIFSQVIWENPIICVIHHPSLNHTQELTVPMTVMEETPNKNPGMDITLTCVLIALILISLFIFYLWRLLPAEKKQGLLCCVLPVCPGIATDGKYAYTLQEVAVKSLPEGKLPDR